MFNALKYSKDLEAAGFSREQAEATISVFFKFMEHNFATKEDLSLLKSDLKSDLDQVRTDLTVFKSEVSSKFEMLEHRMTIKFGIMQTAAVGFLGALIKFF